jgi:Putative peptidoglycan-binding domain-containing protein
MATILAKGSRGDIVKQLQKALSIAGFKVFEDGIFGEITKEAVMAFQKANNLTPDGIVGEKTWAKLPKINSDVVASKRTINEIIVHCTATPEGRKETVDSIRLMHKQRGWSDIGYHYLVYLDGSTHAGRNVNLIGAHCEGHNAHSIGVCYVGGVDKKMKPKDTRTDDQKKGLENLLKNLKKLYPKAKIYGHRDFNSGKACPSFDAKKEYKDI